jgi:uncharacterized protein
MSDHKHPANALALETSPYLLQHAHNPVQWLPWGPAAFEKARLEDKPILLSVGYSACHWCHVMERESFENPVIAQVMNEFFVPVKVDREERPDVDSVYMNAVQVMTGSGGWPMTVFLTPDGKPFYGGTYFPPEDRYGRPGFRRIMESLNDAWTNRRDDVLESAGDLTKHLGGMETLRASSEPADVAVLESAFAVMTRNFDATWGGFEQAPKFPNPGGLEWLLNYHQRTGDETALAMLEKTLTGMAVGGMYDQLGGGFARYSTDERWLAPHFEKMLYDNAQLVKVYLHTYQVTGKPFYARIVRETLEYVLREMTSPEGAFYSAQDADSEGVEGKFYVWTLPEIQKVLGDETSNDWMDEEKVSARDGTSPLPSSDANLFSSAFGVTAGGNWEGHNILVLAKDANQLSQEFKLPPDEIALRLRDARAKLFAVRSERIWPGLDDKTLTSWNGLMLGAFAEAARVLNEPRYLEAAEKNVKLVREKLFADGRLLHTYKAATTAKINGLLEDYALYALGLCELYRTIFDREVLEFALELTQIALGFFHEPGKGFFDTPHDGEKLIVRPKSFFDSAMPSGNGAMALLLTQLGRLTGKPEYEEIALEAVHGMADFMRQQPTGFGSLLQALEASIAPHREIAVIGDLEQENTWTLLEQIHKRFLPFVSLAAAQPGESYLPVLEHRDLVNGSSAAYVCENLACQLPVTTAQELETQIEVMLARN